MGGTQKLFDTFKQFNRNQVEATRNPKDNFAVLATGVSGATESDRQKEERAQAIEAAQITGGLEEQVSAQKKKNALLNENRRRTMLGRRSTIMTSGRGVSGSAPGMKKKLGA